ncbi:YceD family protein [Erythrobacter litoralis]|uniref:YceD family protein n=1 Tax=Erythrobacter litoralis TaxID=39960 RepID=UPI0024360CA4|nr:DUF177 domain-containing protein [Erythrobacter litoralis]
MLRTTEKEREALAERFSVSSIPALSANIALEETDAGIVATGTLDAEIVQPCAVTREDFNYVVHERVALLFVPEGQAARYEEDEEVELDSTAPDEIEYEGDVFDLGEALAQTLGLAIDPYREGPDADEARAAAGIESDEDVDAAPKGPLAEALAGLRTDKGE